MRRLIAILLCLLSFTAHAENEWSFEDKTWGATAGALLLGDWATTNYMTHHYNGTTYYETNPILGQHPTANRVNLYFLVATPAVYLSANYFPEYRKEILMAVSAVELVAVGNNLHIGLKFQF